MSSSSAQGAIRTQRGSSNLPLKSPKPCFFFHLVLIFFVAGIFLYWHWLPSYTTFRLLSYKCYFIYIYISNQVWPRQFLSTLNKIVLFVSSFSKRVLCVGTVLGSAGGAVSKADLIWMTVCLSHWDSAACCQGIHCPPSVNTPMFIVLTQLNFQTQS